jgi:protein-S-isoprenylcysteine O-methyltransferase Ste14
MYLGVVLVTGEWLAIAGLLVVMFAYWRKIRLEEKNLNVAFGEEYNAYRRDTWALVPGVF